MRRSRTVTREAAREGDSHAIAGSPLAGASESSPVAARAFCFSR